MNRRRERDLCAPPDRPFSRLRSTHVPSGALDPLLGDSVTRWNRCARVRAPVHVVFCLRSPHTIFAICGWCSLCAACSDGSLGVHATDAGGVERSPVYTKDGALERPDDWADWIHLGAGFNLSYTGSASPGDLFSIVYMEPSAVAHFEETGKFREGTMTALAVYRAASGAQPTESGEYPGEPASFEMSVKDSERSPETRWAYYVFGTEGTEAEPAPPSACFSCHDDHAETDHVFTQFYPRLP